MSLVRFFDDQTLVCGLVVDGMDAGHDLIKWLCGHPCYGVEHLACIYRLYAKFKYQSRVTMLSDAINKRKVIRLKYDIIFKNREIMLKGRDYATSIKVKGTPHQLQQYLYGKN